MNDVEVSPAVSALTENIGQQSLTFRSVIRGGLKRLLDILASVLGWLALSPVFLVIGILIKRDSPGPVFYRCRRAGRNGKVFQMLKFRTMKECPESYAGPSVTAQDDPRITPMGRWLRETKLNEFPQLWNVLKGEMSLVGPRPEDPEIVATWPAEARRVVLSVRPGVTSQASVLYRHEEKMLSSGNVMDAYLRDILPNKLRLDLLYVHRRSFLTDLDVIFWTLIALFPQNEERSVQEERLFAGPLANFVRRYMSWFMVDILVASLAIGLVGVIWRLNGPLNLGVRVYLGLAVCIGFLFGMINSILGLKSISWRRASPVHVFDLALSSGITTILVFLADSFWPSRPFFPKDMVIVIGLFAFLGFVAVRYRQRLLTGLASRWAQARGQEAGMGERVLIVGAGECGQLAAWLLHKSDLSTAFSIVGMVDDDLHMYKMRIDGYTVLGSTREIPDLVKRHSIGVILYAISKINPAERDRILAICRSTPARLVLIPDLIQVLKDRLLGSNLEEARNVSLG